MPANPLSGFLTSVTKKLVAREETIGTTRRVVDLSRGDSEVAAIRPVVSLKTLYTDFEVRELPAFYGSGAPLRLELDEREAVKDEGTNAAAKDDDKHEAERGCKRARDADGLDGHGKTEIAAPSTTANAVSVADTIGPLVSAEDLAALQAGLAEEAKSIPLPSVVDKEKRGQLHKAIKACLGTTHVSNTVSGVVCVVKANAADRREERRRSRTERPPPRYHHFTLYKENTDSNQALRMIASHLRLSSRQIQFCGTKDKRAVTLQRVAIRETTVERLKSINGGTFGLHNIVKVSGFTQESHGLRLGDANGNHFRIVLRVFPNEASGNVGDTASPPESTALTAAYLREVERVVRTVGVINYFGPQRFGTTDVLTSDVGACFLQGNLRGGLRLMLASKASIVPEMRTAVELYESQKYAEALQAAPYYCYQERDILKHLSTNPNDFLGALQSMARTMAMMYFHAVQSLVWNRMASTRLCGANRMHAEAGDLVLETTYQARRKGQTDPQGCSTLRNGEEEGEDGNGGAANDSKLPAVHTLTAEDDCSRFTLADVLLPVPGPDQDLVYPTSSGCSRAAYEEVLHDLKIDFTSKEAVSLMKLFHFHGTYRALGVCPTDFELQLQTVPSWRTPVLRSDWQLYCAQHGIEVPAADVSEGVAAAEPQGEVQVVLAAFSLPPGSYATSVLREFCIPSTENFRSTEAAAPDE